MSRAELVKRNRLRAALNVVKHQSQNQLFKRYRAGAVRRDIEFNVSLPYFARVIARDCHYCGCEPNSEFRNGKKQRKYTLKYNGIDRINNDRGYLPRNCVPACKRCNYAKSKLTKEEFLDMVERIYRKHFNF